jgi:hypothetical protein
MRGWSRLSRLSTDMSDRTAPSAVWRRDHPGSRGARSFMSLALINGDNARRRVVFYRQWRPRT